MSEFESRKGHRPTSKDIVDRLRVLGEDYGFDPETCDEIAKLSFEEALETAYGYLVQAGIDPDDVLAEFIEPAS
jgi:hypothetical protein